MRIDRLFSILVILLNKSIITAKELADRFEVSTRTIYRDIDTLSSAGIPIYANRGSGGGISLLDSYTINKTMISEKDSEGLLVALKTLKVTKYPDIDEITNKLSSLFQNIGVNDWIQVDYSQWGASKESISRFSEIKESILNNQLISFVYFNSYGEKSKRKVNPIRLIYKGQAWYLWAFCELKKDFRLFKINRIKELDIIDEYFKREELSQLENYNYETHDNKSRRNVELKLRFNRSIIYRLYDHFEETDLVNNDDGTYQLEVCYPEGEWIYSFLQSFGDSVEVISPQYVREELIYRLEQNLKKYKK
ncbi:helix-turn-helix transcriptional regulator [Sporosalibacterium faouarense]|uniref:helix-turn-helix transcriptional regulator n=1 Tax=Sporosalibacterium faouarense TaxID=516123 RepID=UPI00192C53A5|nr:YafY family protein [Sporosalibacterium faouarense]